MPNQIIQNPRGTGYDDFLLSPDENPASEYLRWDWGWLNGQNPVLGPGSIIYIDGNKNWDSITLHLNGSSGDSSNPIRIVPINNQVKTKELTVLGGDWIKISGKYIPGVQGHVDYRGHELGWNPFWHGSYGFYVTNDFTEYGSLVTIGRDSYYGVNGYAKHYEIEYVESGAYGFAAFRVINDGASDSEIYITIHDCVARDTDGEGFYIGKNVIQGKVRAYLYNNLFVRCGAEAIQVFNNVGDGRIYNNTVIMSSFSHKDPFYSSQSGTIQYISRYGSQTIEKNIVVASHTNLFSYYGAYTNIDDALRSADNLVVRKNLFIQSRTGRAYQGTGSVPPTNILPNLIVEENWIDTRKEDGLSETNWLITTTGRRGYAITVRNNKYKAGIGLTALAQNTVDLTSENNSNEDIDFPLFTESGWEEKGVFDFRIPKRWGLINMYGGIRGNTNIAGKLSIDLSTLSIGNIITLEAHYNTSTGSWSVGQEFVFIEIVDVDTEDSHTWRGLDLPEVQNWFAGTIQSFTINGDSVGIYDFVTLQVQITEKQGTGVCTDFMFTLNSSSAVFNQGEIIERKGKFYKVLKSAKFKNPDYTNPGGASSEWYELIVWNNDGQASYLPPDLYTLNSSLYKTEKLGIISQQDQTTKYKMNWDFSKIKDINESITLKQMIGGVNFNQFIPSEINLTESGTYSPYSPVSNVAITIAELGNKRVSQRAVINFNGTQTISIPNNSAIVNDSFVDGQAPPEGQYLLNITYDGDVPGSIPEFELKKLTIKAPISQPTSTTLLHFIVIGQSQAIGTDSTPKLGHTTDPNVLMLGSLPRIDEELTQNQINTLNLQVCQESIPNVDTISVAFGRYLLHLLNNPLYKVCVTIAGVGGRGIVSLTKGGASGTFEAALYAAQRVKSLCDSNGWNYQVHHIWMHGGNAGADYYNQLVQHISDFRTDFGAVTSQLNPIWVIMDQIRQLDGYAQDLEPSHLMRNVMRNVPNVVISHGRYQTEYWNATLDPAKPTVHTTSNGQRQAAVNFARAAYNRIYGDGTFRPLDVDSIAWNAVEKKFIVTFTGVSGTLSGVGNFGFYLYNETSSLALPFTIDIVNNQIEIIPDLSGLSVGDYNIRIDAGFEPNLGAAGDEFNKYPDFNDDAVTGYLYAVDSTTPIFLDVRTNQPISMNRYLIRSRNYKTISVLPSGVNTAPVAQNVAIVGDLYIDRTISATYTYMDADNDLEGNSIVTWYIADDALGTNETSVVSSTLLLQASHEGKYIDVGITPIAQTGVTTGIEVRAGYNSAVTILPPLELSGKKVQVHLDRYSSDEDHATYGYWNGKTLVGTAGTILSSGLKNEDGVVTSMSMVLVAPANPGGYSAADWHVDISNFPYPESVVRNRMAETDLATVAPAELYFGELNNAKTYKITVWGYTNTGTAINVEVIVNGVSKFINTNQNVNSPVIFDGVNVDANNRIHVKYGESAGSPTYATLNAIIIEESILPPNTNQPPTVSNVTLSGTLQENQTLFVSYNYNDNEGDPEGSTIIKWYESADGIGSGSLIQTGGNELLLGASHIGKYIDVGVTPIAQTGETEGSELRYGWKGPVIAEPIGGDTESTFSKLLRTTDAQLLDTPGYTWISNYGMWEYKPKNFNPANKYPCFISLHGVGECGEGTSVDLNKLIGTGMGKWIYDDKEEADLALGNMVVLIPQTTSKFWSWSGAPNVILAVKDRSYIDPNRIYMSGYSAGGYGVRLVFHDANSGQYLAAAIPICADWVVPAVAGHEGDPVPQSIPLWAFGADGDTTTNAPSQITGYVDVYNSYDPPIPAKYTIFANGGHDNSVWGGIYSLARIGSAVNHIGRPYGVPYNQSIYDWCKQFSKGSNPVQLYAPTNLVAVSSGYTSINVTWTDTNTSPAESSVDLEYSLSGQDSWTIVNLPVNTTSYEITDLSTSTSYDIRVRNKGNGSTTLNSVYSAVVTETTDTPATQLSTPSLSVEAGNGQATITIGNIDVNATAVVLTRATQPNYSNEVAVEEYTSPDTSVIDGSLTNGITYYWRVKVQAEGYIDSSYATASAIPQSPSAKIVQIHLDRYNDDQGSAGAYWNGVNIKGVVDGTQVRENLKDINNVNTGWNMVVLEAAWGVNANDETPVVPFEQFPYPELVVKHYTAETATVSHASAAAFYIGGLDQEKTYEVTAWGYFEKADSDPCNTNVKVNGTVQALNVANNVNSTIVFDSVSPDVNGRINIAFGKPDDGSEDDYYVVLNVIIIKEL